MVCLMILNARRRITPRNFSFALLFVAACLSSACATTRIDIYDLSPTTRAELLKKGFKPASIIANSCVKIEYPEESRRRNEEGRVIAVVLTDVVGSVRHVKIRTSSGFELLDTATIGWLSSCRFTPAEKDGFPVYTWTQIAYIWRIAE